MGEARELASLGHGISWDDGPHGAAPGATGRMCTHRCCTRWVCTGTGSIWARARKVALAARGSGVLVLGPPRSARPPPSRSGHPGGQRCGGVDVDQARRPDHHGSGAGAAWHVLGLRPSGQVEVPSELTPLHWSPVEGSRQWDGALVIGSRHVGATRPAGHCGRVPLGGASRDAPGAIAARGRRSLERTMDFVFRAVHRAEARRWGEDPGGQRRWDRARRPGSASPPPRHRERSSIHVHSSGRAGRLPVTGGAGPGRLAELRSRPVSSSLDTIYVCAPARQQALVAPIVVGLIEEIRSATTPTPRTRLPREARWSRRCCWRWTRSPTWRPCPIWPRSCRTGRARVCSPWPASRILSQAERAGPGSGRVHVVVRDQGHPAGVGDLRTLELVSALAGEADVAVRSVSKSPWRPRTRVPRSSVTASTRRQRRLPVDSVARAESATPS